MTFHGTDYGEPWSFKEWGSRPDDGPTKFRLIGGDQGGNPITLGFTHGYSRLDQETAERIVACINALADLDPAKLAALIEACDELRHGVEIWEAPELPEGVKPGDPSLKQRWENVFAALAELRGAAS